MTVAVIAVTSFLCNLVGGQAALSPPAGPAQADAPAFAPVAGRPYRPAPVLRSRHGVLRVRLVIRRGPVDISGGRVVADTYNGSFAAPTLRVHQGDRIEVTLVNELDADTNFHFHGFHVSPAGHGDNVLVHVAPGTSRRYAVRVGPGNQPGTYWYHSHAHGISEGQVMNGLSGLIVVEGMRARLGSAFKRIAERTIGLKAVQVKDGAIPTDFDDISFSGADRPGRPQNTRFVDGQLRPRMRIAPGETQLWHLANISSDVFYRLVLDGTRFTVLAEDANLLDRPRRATTLLLPPGKRFDVLVTGGAPGATALRTLAYNQGVALFPERTLASLRSGGPARRPPARRQPRPPSRLRGFHRLDHKRIAERRRFSFDEGPDGPDFHFRINGEVFDPGRVDVRAKLGTVEEWTLVNTTQDDHPFHIHVNDFQVMRVNGHPYAAHNLQDTAVIPRHGSVVVRIPFRDFTGKSVFHCHILGHEDSGMMQVVDVVR